MESSSGEEYYVASDNTGTPLAVFSINGLMIKQLQYTAYGEIYHDSNPDFQMVIGFHGGLYDPLTKLVHFTQRDYDVLAGRWTSPDYTVWKNVGKEPAPFNLYMFKSNNPLSNELDLKNYVTGERTSPLQLAVASCGVVVLVDCEELQKKVLYLMLGESWRAVNTGKTVSRTVK